MKFIKFLQRALILMFVLLFSFMFLYLYKNEDSSLNDKEYTEIQEIALDDNKTENNPIEEKIIVQEEKVIEKNQESEQKNKKTKKSKVANKFYYNNLNSYAKLIYNSLNANKNNLKSGTTEIKLSNDLAELIEQSGNVEEAFSAAVNAFEFDNPDVFYIDASKLMFYYEKNGFGNYKIYLKHGDQYNNFLLDGFQDETKIINAENEINIIANEILDDANKVGDDYDKVLYVHDWLTSNVKYDQTLSNKNKDSIYGAIKEGEAVCGGYAKAFKYLLDRLNINCIIVQGVGTNELGQENHAWNLVELDGKWYGVDCTWDDPIIVGNLTNYTEKKYYTYFLKGQSVFNSDHKQYENFYGTSIKLNYPKLNLEDY